jgi:hypothetical protein
MIIKIPIYVEVEGLKDQTLLPDLVQGLSRIYSNSLREKKIIINRRNLPELTNEVLISLEYNFLNKEKVLEKMRTSK